MVLIDQAGILAELASWREDEDAVVSMIDTFVDLIHYYCDEGSDATSANTE